MTAETPAPDRVRRFILENHPVRGHWVHIERTWRALREHKDYPPAVRDLLGEAVCASVLLAATLKFRGTLTLQLQGKGEVHLLVAQCTHDFRIRAVARYSEDLRRNPVRRGNGADGQGASASGFHRLVGDEGRLIVTVEADEREMRYQGIVPLEGGSLADCLEAYFASSEQLPTRVRLVADEGRAAGLLVQKLPTTAEEREGGDEVETRNAWQDARQAVATLKPEVLLDQSVENVLQHRFGERDVRLFKGQEVQFECRCNLERVTSILRALGPDEVWGVLHEQGAVTVTCDYCDRPYRFDAVDIESLFAPTPSAEGPRSVH